MQRATILIAAFKASGDLERLKSALAEGLDRGMTINEEKEILIQMYAYAGFPRSLNGINTLMALVEERKTRGIKDEIGKEASPLPPATNKDAYGAKVRMQLAGQTEMPKPAGYQLFAPTIDSFLKEHLFADIFARDVLDFQQRELATISALAAMKGTESQLRFHLKASMTTGLNEGQLREFVAVLESNLGDETAANVGRLLSEAVTK